MSDGYYAGRKVLVVGAARSGIAAARFLIGQGARVVLTDARRAEELKSQIESLGGPGPMLELELGGHCQATFGSCDFVVVSPGVPLGLPVFEECRKMSIPIIAEVELACRHLKGQLLAVTGSNGKTTTTVLAAEMLKGAGLKAQAAGNVGIALTGLVEASTDEDIYVVELSSFQLESIVRFRPHVAAILNLTPDHMDRYPDLRAYAAAKERIFENQHSSDFAVFNADDAICRKMAGRAHACAIYFSRMAEPDEGVFLRSGSAVWRGQGPDTELFQVDRVALKGRHNLENAMAAAAIAILAGAPPASLQETVARFKGVEHRLEQVATIDGVEYVNDSKATNVDSAIKALEAFPGRIIWIAGGRDKGSDYTPLRAIAAGRVKHLLLIGEAASKILEALRGAVEVTTAGSLPQAVQECRRIAKPGDVVLLAPACASFDMFENYEHRGRVFKAAVHELAAQPAA